MIKNTFFGVFGPKIFKLKLFENVSQLLKTVSTIKFSILKLGSPPRCPVCCKKKSPIRAQCYLLSPYDNEQNSVVNKMKTQSNLTTVRKKFQVFYQTSYYLHDVLILCIL